MESRANAGAATANAGMETAAAFSRLNDEAARAVEITKEI